MVKNRPSDGDFTVEEKYIIHDLKVRRVGRVLMYAGLIISGILGVLFPSRLVAAQVTFAVEYIWAMAMAVSALICLFGSLTDRWLGEFTGLPLLAAVLGLYGLAALLAADSESLPLLAYGVVVLSFAAGLTSRWKDVLEIKRASSTSHKGE